MKEKKEKERMLVVNLSVQKKPEFIESKRLDWVKAGADNKFFDDLIDYSNLSATHKAILQTKINGVAGGEIEYINGDDTFTPNDQETLSELLIKAGGDLEIVGAAAIEVIWSKNRKTITEYNHIPMQNLRFEKADDFNHIAGMYYSRDWSNYRQNKPVFIPFYSEKNKTDRQVLLIRKYWAGSPYNIIPSYIGGFNYVKTDFEISKFNLNSIEKGLAPSIIISFNDGKPDPKQADAMNEMIKEKFTGSEGEKLLVLFNDNPDKAAVITELDGSKMADMYTNLSTETSQQILTAHQLTSPALAGIRVPGSLGTGNELLQASELFQKNVINPDQKLLIDKMNKILAVNGVEIKMLSSDALVSAFSEAFLLKTIDLNERRDLIGYEEVEVEQIKEEE